MDSSQHPKKEGDEEQKLEDGLSPKHQKPNSPTITSLPPSSSSSSSPSHEFSFTISLHPSTAKPQDKCKPPPPASFAVDLSPADDIFFHGHLLPLQLISHPIVSPRNSTTSSSNLNPPNRDFISGQKPNNNNCYSTDTNNNATGAAKERSKHKSFSIFGLAKWRKSFEVDESHDYMKKEKKKGRFGLSRVLKKYMRLIQPLFSKGGEKEKRNFMRQPYSFSGNLNSKWKERGGRRGGGFSAPASMRTSPTNSGLLVTTATIASTNDSTMEELQNAIQAAIAHCKNSIAVKEEKFKC